MPAIGMIVAWFGYTVASWGYCLVRGYNVKFTDWINPAHPYRGPWPPPKDIAAGSILPGGAPVTGTTAINTTAQITTAGGAPGGPGGTTGGSGVMIV